MKTILALLLLLTCAPLLAQETAATSRSTELKAEARADSATLATLPEGTPILVLSRGSGFARVQTADKKTGWVRVFHFRSKGIAEESGSGGGILGGLFGGQKRPAPKATATVGIRGLSEEEMKNAKPNAAEFAKMKTYAVSKPDAEAFARRSRLNATPVTYVDANGKPIAGGEK